MNDELHKRGKGLEDGYFAKKERELLEKLKTKISTALCPRDQNQLTTVTQDDVEIDLCEKCGGIWLDNGELEKIVGKNKNAEEQSWFDSFVKKFI